MKIDKHFKPGLSGYYVIVLIKWLTKPVEQVFLQASMVLDP